jgi:5-methylthioadenosine/S-adenosylhomocysteine deaminase
VTGGPEACDLLIEAGLVVPVEPHGVVLERSCRRDARRRDRSRSCRYADARRRFHAAQTVSRPDGVLIPGLVNAHVHNPMTLLRGVADDLPLMDWLQGHIWPLEAQLIGPEFVADGVELAIAGDAARRHHLLQRELLLSRRPGSYLQAPRISCTGRAANHRLPVGVGAQRR